jgi:hypothetical protein
MKPRRWLLALLLAPLLLAGVGLVIWRSFGIDQLIREKLLSILSEAGMEEVQLGAVEPSWSGVSLDKIAFRIPQRDTRVSADRTRVGLSPVALIRQNWDEVLTSLRVERFDLLLGPMAFSPAAEPARQPSEVPFMSRLAFLPDLELAKSRLRWQSRAGGDTLLLADNVEGMLFQRHGGSELLLRSRLLNGSEPQLRAHAMLLHEESKVDFDLQLDSLQLRPEHAHYIDGLQELDARLSLDLKGIYTAEGLEALDGRARLKLDHLKLDHLEAALGGELQLELSRDGVRLHDSWLEAYGARLNLELASGLKGEWLNLKLACDRSSMAEISRGLGLHRAPLADLELRLEGGESLAAPHRFRLDALRPELQGRDFGDLHLEGLHDSSGLLLNLESWQVLSQLKTTGSLKITSPWNDPGARLKLTGQLQLPPLGNERSRRADMDLMLDASFAGKMLKVGANQLRMSLKADGERLLVIQGKVDSGPLPEVGLPGFSALLLDGDGAGMGSGFIESGEDPRWHLELYHTMGSLLAAAGITSGDFAEAPCEVELDGWGRRSSARVRVEHRARVMDLVGELALEDSASILGANLTVTGWRDRQLTGSLRMTARDGLLNFEELRIGELIADGHLDTRTGDYRTTLLAENLAVATFWDLLIEDPPPAGLGRLDLLVAGSGNLEQPTLTGDITYQTELSGSTLLVASAIELDQQGFRLPAASMSLDGTRLFEAHLDWTKDPLERSLDLEFIRSRLGSLIAQSEEDERSAIDGVIAGNGHFRWDSEGRIFGEGWIQGDSIRVGGLQLDDLSGRLFKRAGAEMIELDSLRIQRGGENPLLVMLDGLVSPSPGGEIDLDLILRGELLNPLTVRVDGSKSSFFRKARGSGEIRFNLAGSLLEPRVRTGSLQISGAELDMASVFKKVRDGQVRITVREGRLSIEEFSAAVGKSRVRITNTLDPPAGMEDAESLQLSMPELDLGYLQIQTLNRKGERAPVICNIPGLMESDWDGELSLGGRDGKGGLTIAGPVDQPLVSGLARVRNARFTYPLIKSNEEPTPLLLAIINLLESMEWNVALEVERNVNYYRKVQGFEDSALFENLKGFLDRITVDVFVEPATEPLEFSGRITDESFRIVGEVNSTRGSVVYLDKDFEVDDAGMIFDESTVLPLVWGRAVHTVIGAGLDSDGSMTIFNPDARQIFIQLYSEDDLGNHQSRGRWDEMRIELVDDLNASDNLVLRGQEDLLVELGIDPLDAGASFQSMLPGVVAGMWELPLQPIESRLRRELGLDMVRIFVPVLRNTLEELVFTESRQEQVSQSYLSYFQGSRVMLGKSLGPRYFASWTGQLMSASPAEGTASVHFFQRYNLEYEVNRNLKLTGELVFDPLREASSFKGDPRIMMRYKLGY